MYKRLALITCSDILLENCAPASAPPPVTPVPPQHKPLSLNDMRNRQLAIKRQAHTRPSKHLLELSMADAEVMTMEWGGYLCLSLRITSIFGKKAL